MLVHFLFLSLVAATPYLIKKGDHYSNHSFFDPGFRDGVIQKALLRMSSAACLYFFDTANPGGPETACAAMSDNNKVFGSSRCGYLNPHHQDSDRFTWKRHPDCYKRSGTGNDCKVISNSSCADFQLLAYAYDNGRKPYGPGRDPNLMFLFPTKFEAEITYQLILTYGVNQTSYTILNEAGTEQLGIHTIPHRECSDWKHGYKLWPYFGGQNVSPSNMIVNLS